MNSPTNCRIKVIVKVRYMAEQSAEEDNRFVFAYIITVSNEGEAAVKLLSRHWIITDANNHVQEVKGKGVVGEQPIISPGQSFEYASGTVLATQVGTMSGTYQMERIADGAEFPVPIPEFVLSVPRVLH